MNKMPVLAFSVCLLLPSALSAFCFNDAGKEQGISPLLLESIAKTESGLNPKATHKNKNGSTDIGLMQVNSSWIEPLGLDSARLIADPCYNARTGARILRHCIDRHGYTWEAVGCYNARSKDKRVDYSWKIYGALRNSSVPETAGTPPAGTQSSSSLSFSVRDRDDGLPVFPHGPHGPYGPGGGMQ